MTQWFTETFRNEFDKQAEQIGRINIAIFGKTGAVSYTHLTLPTNREV